VAAACGGVAAAWRRHQRRIGGVAAKSGKAPKNMAWQWHGENNKRRGGKTAARRQKRIENNRSLRAALSWRAMPARSGCAQRAPISSV
jgi:hypothetical protein